MPNGNYLLISVDNQTGIVKVLFEIYNNNFTKQKGTYFPHNYSSDDQLAGEFLEDQLFLIGRIANVTDEQTNMNHSAVFLDFYEVDLLNSLINLKSSQQIFVFNNYLNSSAP